MTYSQACHDLYNVVPTIKWPDDIEVHAYVETCGAVIPTNNNWRLVIDLVTEDGSRSTNYCYSPLGYLNKSQLLAKAYWVAKTFSSGDDAWVNETIQAIHEVPNIPESTVALACRLVRGVEFDGLPTPDVRRGHPRMVAIEWCGPKTSVILHVVNNRYYNLSTSDRGSPYQTFDVQRGDGYDRSFAPLREALSRAFNLEKRKVVV